MAGLSWVHSGYTFRQGAARVEELVDAAVERGWNRIALTDLNGIYGSLFFWDMATDAGLTPILGAELDDPQTHDRAVLLVKDHVGYARLCRLLSSRHLCEGFSLRRALGRALPGLAVLTDCEGLALDLMGVEGLDLYALAPPHKLQRMARLARNSRLRMVAANPVYYVNREDRAIHRLLGAIGRKTSLSALSDADLVPDPAWMPTPDELSRWYRSFPEAVYNLDALLEQCVMDKPPWGEVVLFDFDGMSREDCFALLCRKVRDGAARRYGALDSKTRSRIRKELALIRERGFASYFLIIEDIVKRFPITCGRGSAAASVVSYCLFITHVDPVRHDLLFERFLSRGRKDPPDIDVDFPWDERDGVLDYVFERYGPERTAMVSNHLSFKSRGAVREVARAFGLPDPETSGVTRRMRGFHQVLADTDEMKKDPRFKGVFFEPPWDEIVEAALRIEGLPFGMSVHCGGVVIADRIKERVPLQGSAKGVNVIQWEKDQTEDAGLIKLDLLGNRTLAVIGDGLRAVASGGSGCRSDVSRDGGNRQGVRGEGISNDEYRISGEEPGRRHLRWERPSRSTLRLSTGGRDNHEPGRSRPEGRSHRESECPSYSSLDPLDDGETRALIESGRTMGVFYIESPATRQLQRKAGRGDFEHVVIHSSIIRPAAHRLINEYVRRLRGGSWDPIHPVVDEVLSETYGIMVYQEDVMKVAHHLAGFSIEHADELRRVLSKKHRAKRLKQFERMFLDGCARRGVAHERALEAWGMVMSFTGYSFCKPHSASYALVSFKSAWLKAHHPAEFMAAVISNQGGYYSARAYVSEARRMGIVVLPPDVNHSGIAYSAEDGALRIGLMQVKGLAGSLAERTIEERERAGRFEGLADFLHRLDPDPEQARLLIKSRCFDELEGENRRAALLWMVDAWAKSRSAGPGLFRFEPRVPRALAPLSEDALLAQEVESLGFLVTRHPLELYQGSLEGREITPARKFRDRVGRRVIAVGLCVTGKMVETAKGDDMEFVSFEDETDIYETVFFPDSYRRYCHLLRRGLVCLLTGRVSDELGALALEVDRIRPLRPDHRPNLSNRDVYSVRKVDKPAGRAIE